MVFNQHKRTKEGPLEAGLGEGGKLHPFTGTEPGLRGDETLLLPVQPHLTCPA